MGREIEGLIGRVFRDWRQQGGFDLEALEGAVKRVTLRCGAMALERLVEHEDGSRLEKSCACGGTFSARKRVAKSIATVLGPIRVARTYQRCNACGAWRVPEDKLLDVERTGFSPGLRRMMAKTGAELCFDKARDMIRELAGVAVSDKDVERIAEAVGADIAEREQCQVVAAMADELPPADEAPGTLYIAADGTGVPVLRRETQGRVGKAADGIARTREVKLGAVFTQSRLDKQGNAIRDPASTTYAGRIESAESFGQRLYAEAHCRGVDEAQRVAFIGDGAPWLWNLAETHFSRAVQILDYYHACEQITGLAKLLYPQDEVGRKRWSKPLLDYLWEGELEHVLNQLCRLKLRGTKREAVQKTIAYIEKNQARMRYDEFRRSGLFIGSGVVEAGCRTLIGGRLKRSGMHWSVRGANAIIALRCCIESGEFETYWESRRAA